MCPFDERPDSVVWSEQTPDAESIQVHDWIHSLCGSCCVSRVAEPAACSRASRGVVMCVEAAAVSAANHLFSVYFSGRIA